MPEQPEAGTRYGALSTSAPPEVSPFGTGTRNPRGFAELAGLQWVEGYTEHLAHEVFRESFRGLQARERVDRETNRPFMAVAVQTEPMGLPRFAALRREFMERFWSGADELDPELVLLTVSRAPRSLENR